jgi:hypothetical protein
MVSRQGTTSVAPSVELKNLGFSPEGILVYIFHETSLRCRDGLFGSPILLDRLQLRPRAIACR